MTQNLQPSQPSLRDALDAVKREVMLEIKCHHIGTIEAFDAATQTATVSIAYPRTFLEPNDKGVYVSKTVAYPAVVEAPVVFLGGANSYLTFPVAKGDECLLLFNDRDIDNWYAGNTNAQLASSRLHAFADAIALVGIRSKPSAIEDFDTERVVIRKGDFAQLAIADDNAALENGDTVVRVNEDKVLVANTTTTLNTLLQNLLMELQNLTTQLSTLSVTGVTAGAVASGPPVNAAAITSIGTNIGVIATDIAGLLE